MYRFVITTALLRTQDGLSLTQSWFSLRISAALLPSSLSAEVTPATRPSPTCQRRSKPPQQTDCRSATSTTDVPGSKGHWGACTPSHLRVLQLFPTDTVAIVKGGIEGAIASLPQMQRHMHKLRSVRGGKGGRAVSAPAARALPSFVRRQKERYAGRTRPSWRCSARNGRLGARPQVDVHCGACDRWSGA